MISIVVAASIAFARGQSTYDVYDYQIISARNQSGRTYRLAVVNDRQFESPIGEFEGQDGLGENERRAIPVGSSKKLEFTFVTIQTIGGHELKLEPIGLKDSIVIDVHHLKSCPVDVTDKEESKIIGDSSKGIITIPKVVKFRARRFTAACATPDDRVFEQPTSTANQKLVADAQKKNTDLDNDRELNSKISQRAEQLKRELYKKTQAVSLAPIPADALHQAFCPGTAQLMIASGIKEIRIEKVETKHVEHPGYTEIAHAYTFVITPLQGETSRRADSDFRDLGDLGLVLKPDTKTCLSIEAHQAPASEELRKHVKLVDHQIELFNRDRFEEQARKELTQAPGAAAPSKKK